MAKYIDQSVAIARLTHIEVTKPTATMTDAKRVVTCSECGNAESSESYYCRYCGAKMDL